MSRQALAAGMSALALAGCAHLSAADKGPRSDPVARLAPTSATPWREDFGDPILRSLLVTTDAGALTGKLALARLARADAEVEAADAVRTVNVVAGLSAAVGGETFHDGARSAGTPTLEVRHDLDVWGRLAHGRRAARADRAAAASDVDAARLQVAAETVRSYLVLAAARDSAAIAERREAAAREALIHGERRLAAGAAQARDLAPARAALIAAQDARARAIAQASLELARLADLAGGPVDVPSLGPARVAPSLIDPASPVPSSAVDRRPDVLAAHARLQAADEHRAAAIAASRPQFQIAAALGSPDAAVATLLDVRSLAWAAAATVSHEILDGRARRARVHVATAEADIADLAYRQAVLGGWQDIRAAVAEAADARRVWSAAETSAQIARDALAEGEIRRRAGALDGGGAARLKMAVADAEQAACDARLRLGVARVALVLARGPS